MAREPIKLSPSGSILPSPECLYTGTTQSSDFPTHGATGAYQGGTLAHVSNGQRFWAQSVEPGRTERTDVAEILDVSGRFRDGRRAGNCSGRAECGVRDGARTSSWDFPWHDNLQPFNGAGDAFIAKLDPTSAGSASLIYATPLGGTSPVGGRASALGNGVAADNAGHVYVAGATTSGNFPTAVTTENPVNGFQTAAPVAP